MQHPRVSWRKDPRSAVARSNRKPSLIATSAPLPSRSADGSQSSSLRRAAELFHPLLLRRTILVGIGWFGSTGVYYAVVLAPPAVEGDVYVQNALGGLLELPAYLAMPVMGECCGRPRAWALFLAVVAAALLALELVPRSAEGGSGVLLLSLLARFGATGTSMIWLCRRGPMTYSHDLAMSPRAHGL